MSVSVTSDLNLLNLPAADLSGIDVITRDGFSGTWVGFGAGVSSRKPRNVGMGYRLMTSSRDAAQNTAMGYAVAERLTGDNNVLMGAYVAQRVTARLTENVIIGATAAQYVGEPLFRNVWIGFNHGFSNARTCSNCIGIGAEGSALGNRVISIGSRSLVDGSALVSIGHDNFVNARNNVVIGNRITNIGSNCLIIKTNHNDVPWVNSNSDYLNINDVLISERLDDGQTRATFSNDVLRFKSALTSITLSNTFVSLDGVRSQISLGDVIRFQGLYSSMVLDKDITFSGCNTSLVLAESGIVSYNGKDASLRLGSNIVYLQGSNATDIAVLGSNTGLLINSNSISLVGSNARDIVIAGSNARLVLSSNIQLVAPRASAMTLVASNAGLFLAPTSVSLCNASATSLGLVGSNASLVLAPTSVSLTASDATSIRFTGASNTSLAITPSNILLSGPSANSISLVASNNTRVVITPGQMGMIGPSATLLSITGSNMSLDMTPSNVELSAPRAGRFAVTLSNNTQLLLTSNVWIASGPGISNMTMAGASNMLWRTSLNEMVWSVPTARRLEMSLSNASFVVDTVGNRADFVSSNADPMRFVASNAVWTLGSRTLTGCNLHPTAVVGWVGPYGASWTLDASNASLVGSNLVQASMVIAGGETSWIMNPQTLRWVGSNAESARIVVGSNGSALAIDANASNPSASLAATGADVAVRMSMRSDALDWRIDRPDPTFVRVTPASGFSFAASSNVSHATTRTSVVTTGPGLRSWSVLGNPSTFSWLASDSNVTLYTPNGEKWFVVTSNGSLDFQHDRSVRLQHELGVSLETEEVFVGLDRCNVSLSNATGGSNVNLTMTGSNTVINGPLVLTSDPVIRGASFSNWLAQAAAPSTLSNLTITGTLNVPGNAVMQSLTVSNLTALSNNIVITTIEMSSNTVTGFSNGIQVFGPATFDSNLHVRGALTVDGPVTFSNPSFVLNGMVSMSNAGSVFRIDPPAQLQVGGTASFTGPCNVNISGTGQLDVSTTQSTVFRNADVIAQCNLIVTGNDAIINRRLTVNGNATFAGPAVTVRSNLVVEGTSTFEGPLNVVNASPATFGGPVVFDAPSTFSNDVLVLGITTLSNDVRVSGAAEFRSNVRSQGTLDQFGAAFFWSNVYMHRAFAVNGPATLCNALEAFGDARFRNDLDVDQALTVAGPTSLAGPLLVTGPFATFCNPVTVTQPLRVTSNLIVERGIEGSSLTISGGPLVVAGVGASFTVSNSAPSTFYGPVDHYDRVRHWCNVDTFGEAVFYNSNTTVCNALDVFGPLEANGGALVTGGAFTACNDFYAMGAIAQVAGTLSVGGALTVESDALMRSNLTVQAGDLVVSQGSASFQGSSVQVDGTFRTFGNVLMFSNVDAFSQMTVWDRFEARGTGSNAFIVSRGDATFSNAALVAGSFSAATGSTAADITLGGCNMTVTTSNVLFSNHRMQINSPLYTQSNVFVQQRLVVSSNATFCNDALIRRDLVVTSNTSVGGSLFAAGPTTLSNTLDVTGASANFWSNVFVNGVLTANQLVTFSNVIQQTVVQIVGSNTTFSNDVVFLGRTTFCNTIVSTSNLTTTGLATLCNDLRVFGASNRIGGQIVLGDGAMTIDRSNVVIGSNAPLAVESDALIRSNLTVQAGDLVVSQGSASFQGSAVQVAGTLRTFGNVLMFSNVDAFSQMTVWDRFEARGTGSNAFVVSRGDATFSNAALVAGSFSAATGSTSADVAIGGRNMTVTTSNVLFSNHRLQINSPMFAQSNVFVQQRLVVSSNATFCNDALVGRNLTVACNVAVGGSLYAAGPTTLSNTLDVTGAVDFWSNVFVNGVLTANQLVTFSNIIQQTIVQLVGSNTTFAEDVVFLGRATFSNTIVSTSNFTTTGLATLCNDLRVFGTSNRIAGQIVLGDGAVTIDRSNVVIDSNVGVDVQGTLDVYDNVNLYSNLVIGGTTTACNGAQINGSVRIAPNAISDNLLILMPTTFCNSINVTGPGAIATVSNLVITGITTIGDPSAAAETDDVVRIIPVAPTAPASNTTLPNANGLVGTAVVRGNIVFSNDVTVVGRIFGVGVGGGGGGGPAPSNNTTTTSFDCNVEFRGGITVMSNVTFSNNPSITLVGDGLLDIRTSNTAWRSNIDWYQGAVVTTRGDVTVSNDSNLIRFTGGSNGRIDMDQDVSIRDLTVLDFTATSNVTFSNNPAITLVGNGLLDIRTSNTAWRSNIDWYQGAVVTTRGDVTVSNDSNLIRFTGGSNGRIDMDQDVSIRDLTVLDFTATSNVTFSNNPAITLVGNGLLDIRTSNTAWRSNIDWYQGAVVTTRGDVTVSNDSNLIRFTGGSNGRIDMDQDVSIRDLTVLDFTATSNVTFSNNPAITLVGNGLLDIRTSNTAWRSNIDWYQGAVVTTRGDVTVSNDSNLIRFTGGSNGRIDMDQDVSIRDLTVRDTITLSNIAWEGGLIALGASNETLRAWSNVPDQIQHRFEGSLIVDSNLYLGGRLFANGFTMTVIETLRAELQDLIVSGTMTLCNTTLEGVLTLGHCNGPPLIFSNIPDLVQHRTEGTLIVDSNLYVAGRIFCQGVEWSAVNSMELYDSVFYGTATFCNTAVEGVLRIGGSNRPFYAFSNIENSNLNTFEGAVHIQEDLYVSGRVFCNGIEWTSLNNQVINDAVIQGRTTFCNARVDGHFVLGNDGPYTAWTACNLVGSNSVVHHVNGALVVEEDVYISGRVFANGLSYTWCNVAAYIADTVDATNSFVSRSNATFYDEAAFDSNAKVTFQTSNVLFVEETQHRGAIQMMSGHATLPSWTISLSSDTPLVSDLVFRSKNDTVLTMTDDFTSSVLNFTGKHLCVISDRDASSSDEELIGKVVIATGSYEDLDGVATVHMDEAVPVVELCEIERDPRVFGVIGAVERQGTPRRYKVGNLGFEQAQKRHSKTRVVVHALGEGLIDVDDSRGPIRNGDLLCASANRGYACKQDDDIIRSMTIAKATTSCAFEMKGRARIGCVYKC